MAQKIPPSRNQPKSVEYVYRGKTIHLDQSQKEPKLFVDSRQVMYEQTEDGVLSHEAMYMVFGSPFELAEELIRQWGEADIVRGKAK